jgi:hypothetical protein
MASVRLCVPLGKNSVLFILVAMRGLGLMAATASAQDVSGSVAVADAVERALVPIERYAVTMGCAKEWTLTGTQLHNAHRNLLLLKSATLDYTVESAADAAIFDIESAKKGIEDCEHRTINSAELDRALSALRAEKGAAHSRQVSAGVKARNDVQKITEEYAMRRAATDCYNAGKNDPPDGTALVTTYRCQADVYTKYGAAEELAGAKEKLAKAEEDRRQIQARQAKEAAAFAAAAQLHRERCEHALAVRIGMSANQVLASDWGNPSDRHSTTTANHRREQWVYRMGPECHPTGGQSFLYFEDGILTAIQD